MSMTNFRAEDMPGNPGSVSAEPAKAEKPAKAAPKKAAAPKVAPSAAPEQTNTETHGVGPSTVEGAEVSEETKDALAESVGAETPEENN